MEGILTRIDTTTVVVEADTVGVLLRGGHSASSVPSLGSGTVRPADDIPGDAKPRAARRRDCAPVTGVNRRLVVRVVVHTLHNVDLATGGPVGTVTPERRPRPAPGRHVYCVEQDKPAGVGVLGRDADGLPIARDLGCCVNTHDGVPGGVNFDEVGRSLQRCEQVWWRRCGIERDVLHRLGSRSQLCRAWGHHP